MRKTFILFVLYLVIASQGKLSAKNQGHELNDLLLSYMKVEDIHPDSMESNIEHLKQKRLLSKDEAERAVYAAAIARLYGERISWRSVGNDLRDSMVHWYGVALADKQILARTKAKRWRPFVVLGKDEGYFGGDMLNVVWRSMIEQTERYLRTQVLPNYGEMIDFYRQHGMRNAALLLTIDSLYDHATGATESELLKVRDDYSDLPLCAEVYLRLGTDDRKSKFQRREWLQQGIKNYPGYKRKSALQNALTRLSDPFFEVLGLGNVYPGKTYQWVIRARNVQSVIIDGVKHDLPKHDPIESFNDTLTWIAPKPGSYERTFIPCTSAKLTEKIKPLKRWVRVSALQEVLQVLPNGKARVLVVDSETGEPQPDVTVAVFPPTSGKNDTIAYFVGQTNCQGKVDVPFYETEKSTSWPRQLAYRLSTPDEQHLPLIRRYFYNVSRWEGAPTDSTSHIELFTDRAIYRPGQTVHVSGLAYRQLDWEARASGGEEHTLRFYDSNRKLVEERSVNADEMGVFSADFVIPVGRRNGTFRILADGKETVYFRVEEYKRPTFEVTLEDSLYVDGDTCEVRGRALNYDGSPLRGARVTGTCRWQTPWFYYTKRNPSGDTQTLDTIETDDKGRFVYRIKINGEELRIDRKRLSLSVNVDVLSQQGETHNAQHWYWRLNEPQPEPEPEPVRVDSTLLVRCVSDSFSEDHPGRIEITTNLEDVYLHYTLSAAGKVWTDNMVKISGETYFLEIPYREEYDQSLTASFCFVKKGKVYSDMKTIRLVRPADKLRVHWDTFRDLLQPGQKEEWKLTLRRPDGAPADANLMLTMYDASLDYFNNGDKHRWNFSVSRGHRTFGVPYEGVAVRDFYMTTVSGWYDQKTKKERELSFSYINPDCFQTPVYSRSTGNRLYRAMGGMPVMKTMEAEVPELEKVAVSDATLHEVANVKASRDNGVADKTDDGEAEEETMSVPMRENFDETAFFYPQLRTDKEGQVSIVFTLPESLTRWNLLGFAHTRDMLYANLTEEVEARKDLMAQLYLPRFLRPGDEALLTATVRNVSEQQQKGRGLMQILDAKTERVLKSWKCNVNLAAQKDTVIHYPLSLINSQLPEGLIVRWAVEGTTCSDGEQRLLPVLPATMHMTNTLAITAYNPSVQNIDLTKLFPSTATNRRLTVEYTTHPEQYALQTLPSLARTNRNDVLSLVTAYYAGALGKALNVKMTDSTEVYMDKLKALQDADGGFSWFSQMPASPYLTREVSFLLTRLHMLTGTKHAGQINEKAIHYLLRQRVDSTYLSVSDLRILYVALYGGVNLSKEEQKKVDFLLKLAKREDVEEDGYERQALLAIVLKQAGAERKASKCMKAFRKYLVSSPERGTYIEFPKGSFSSIDRKLHVHVQLMEALQRVAPDDTLLVGMRRYLLQQKRTQEWSTPINSANAVFALLNPNGREDAGATQLQDLLTLTRKNSPTQNFMAKDDSLGYIRDSLEIEDGKLPMRLRLHKFSKGESWGGIYADFEQPFDQVESHATGLSIKQEYPTNAKAGSRYTVRYRISADRDYEYVTLICPRPAFTEPVDQRSGYRWSRQSPYGWGGGLGYYRQVHDTTTEYNFYQIPRGDYLIEETLYVERDGRYHSGVAVIRCEYADEFQGHSDDCVVSSEGSIH